MLGPDREQWATKAWVQAGRWEQTMSRVAETRLLLAIAGMDVYQLDQVIGEHAARTGAITANPWGAPLTCRQQAEHAKSIADRLLQHTIWPGPPLAPWQPDRYGAKRVLGSTWACKTNSGYFHSQKLNRTVMYESPLEHETLQQLDSDPRVIEIARSSRSRRSGGHHGSRGSGGSNLWPGSRSCCRALRLAACSLTSGTRSRSWPSLRRSASCDWHTTRDSRSPAGGQHRASHMNH
jgi:hypothetical protein